MVKEQKKYNQLRIIISMFLVIVMLSTTTVFAATTLLSYDGTGIRGKDSVHSFELSKKSTITVKHTTTDIGSIGGKSPSNYSIVVSLLKKNNLFYNSTGDDFTVKGIKSKNATWTKSAGTYKLHFQAKKTTDGLSPAFDIKGKVVK